MTNLDSIFKSRDIILSMKVRLVKAMVFPVVIYGVFGKTSLKTAQSHSDCLIFAKQLLCAKLCASLDAGDLQDSDLQNCFPLAVSSSPKYGK